jgi:hypothetical protein
MDEVDGGFAGTALKRNISMVDSDLREEEEEVELRPVARRLLPRRATIVAFGPSWLGRRPFIGSKMASAAPARSANRSKALRDTDDDKWAPHVSEFKIQNKPRIQFLAWEK